MSVGLMKIGDWSLLKLRNCFVLQKKLITRSEEGDTGDTGRDEEIRDNECGLLSWPWSWGPDRGQQVLRRRDTAAVEQCWPLINTFYALIRVSGAALLYWSLFVVSVGVTSAVVTRVSSAELESRDGQWSPGAVLGLTWDHWSSLLTTLTSAGPSSGLSTNITRLSGTSPILSFKRSTTQPRQL